MKFSKFIPVFLITSLILIAVPTQSIHAATITAGTAAELIAAINTANASGADDVITLTADITLDAVNNTTKGRTGLPAITSKITILGLGYTIQRDLSFSTCETTENLTQDFRIFYVSSTGDLSLSDITIRNGCANDQTSNGGSIYYYGGGIYNAGTLTIWNSTFKENKANRDGGAFVNIGGTVTISNSTFSNNAGAVGGAIANNFGTINTISNSTFTENSAVYLDAGRGGAIINSFGTISLIENSTFTKNSADGGGAITNIDFGTISKIKNSTFNENSSTEYGGAINNCTSISLGATITSIENSTFSGNYAKDNGGAIFNSPGGPYGTVICTIGTITSSTFSGNRLAATSTNSGAGIANENTITTISNTFIANSMEGDNCEGTIPAGSGNMDDDNSCDPGTSWGTITPGTDFNTTLTDNGGPTKTHALLSGSSAIDQVDCDNAYTTDQRGATRENDIAGEGNDGSNYCDIGAFEYSGDDTGLTVVSSNPSNNSTIESISELTINYSKNALSDSSADAANNTANYLLVEQGSNAYFDTLSCAGGVISDDTQINIDSANYNSGIYTVTLSLNGGTALSSGQYRLFVCGTTSVHDLIGLELNGGLSDATIDFTIATTAASSLPSTGFRHGQVTQLAQQPAAKAYTATAMTLEIPKLGVSMPIVGVPQSSNSWDVTWLGNSAGYLYGSAFPTWAGNTVITGHVWDAYNRPGPFAELKSLKYGDQVQIQAWGKTYTYEVRESTLVTQKNTNVVFQSEQYDWLTLVTCEFYNPFSGEYLFRRAVRAVLVSVQ